MLESTFRDQLQAPRRLCYRSPPRLWRSFGNEVSPEANEAATLPASGREFLVLGRELPAVLDRWAEGSRNLRARCLSVRPKGHCRPLDSQRLDLDFLVRAFYPTFEPVIDVEPQRVA